MTVDSALNVENLSSFDSQITRFVISRLLGRNSLFAARTSYTTRSPTSLYCKSNCKVHDVANCSH